MCVVKPESNYPFAWFGHGCSQLSYATIDLGISLQYASWATAILMFSSRQIRHFMFTNKSSVLIICFGIASNIYTTVDMYDHYSNNVFYYSLNNFYNLFILIQV